MNHFDIVIVGGGMVGAALACALSQTTLRIALVDASPLNLQDDPRLIAINYNSFCLLQAINCWEMLAPHAAPINEVHVSDRGKFGKVNLKKDNLNIDALGFVIPAKDINRALNSLVAQFSKNISVCRPATLKQLTQTDDTVTLHIEKENQPLCLTAKLVIGADGTHSTVRQLLNIDTSVIDYSQSALVTITDLKRTHAGIAYERFCENGAIAMLPLLGNHCATIWTDDNAAILGLMQLDDFAFLKHLQKTFGYRVGRLLKIGKRHVYPLKKIIAKKILSDRVLLIGNAAHTLSPIGAQGLNLALAEIAKLMTLVKDESFFNTFNWNDYLDWQQNMLSTSETYSHKLTEIFSKKRPIINLVRPIAMVGMDLCSSAKNYLAWQAMGS